MLNENKTKNNKCAPEKLSVRHFDLPKKHPFDQSFNISLFNRSLPNRVPLGIKLIDFLIQILPTLPLTHTNLLLLRQLYINTRRCRFSNHRWIKKPAAGCHMSLLPSMEKQYQKYSIQYTMCVCDFFHLPQFNEKSILKLPN